MAFDELSNRVIACAIEVHRELGPGLLESAYEQCLARKRVLYAFTCRWDQEKIEIKSLNSTQLVLTTSSCWARMKTSSGNSPIKACL